MNRSQILWLEAWIALCGAVFWLHESQLPFWSVVISVSLVWATIATGSIWISSLENLSHRLTAFLGFLLFTIEGVLGLVGVQPAGGLVGIAFLHGFGFVLSVIGKYKAQNARRPKRSWERLTEEVVAQAKAPKSVPEGQSDEVEGA